MDMMNMLGKLKEAQAKIKETQEGLANITAEGDAGAGMVKAVVNGKKQVLRLEIDPSLLGKPEDQEILQDLVVAAVNKALQEAEGKAQAEMQRATQEMFPGLGNIPGMNFPGF